MVQHDQVRVAGPVESSRISWVQEDQVGTAGPGWSRVRREQQQDQGRGTSSVNYTDKKRKKIFLMSKEIQNG